MKKIEVAVLNPDVFESADRMLMVGARLTQRGHEIHNLADFMELYSKPFNQSSVSNMCSLPHPTLQKLAVINVMVVGASRRFLAQITRHQNEVKFVSASLQYSNYSDSAAFAIPYKLLAPDQLIKRSKYFDCCRQSADTYAKLIDYGADHDSAGYVMPQGLRNVLVISATPYQWKHMISQRVCRRNTDETRIVMLKIWEKLYTLDPAVFSPMTTGPFCMLGACKEGKMSCRRPILYATGPKQILEEDYPLLEVNDED